MKNLNQQGKDSFGDGFSEIDKWYAIGDNFWLRRTTPTTYLCVQVYPIMEMSHLCYLHVLNIEEYENKTIEQYKVNVPTIPELLPTDIQHIYPVAFSLDVDKAAEMFLAANDSEKTEWLNKMGIK